MIKKTTHQKIAKVAKVPKMLKVKRSTKLNTVISKDVNEALTGLLQQKRRYDMILADAPSSIDIWAHLRDQKISPPSLESWRIWCQKWIDSCMELLSENGILHINGFEYDITELRKYFPKDKQHSITWNIGCDAPNPPRSVMILTLWKNDRDPKDLRKELNVYFSQSGNYKENLTLYEKKALTFSSYSKPINYSRELIKDFTKANNRKPGHVLVLFAGTGSECIAAKSLGIPYIGIDISDYQTEDCRKNIEDFPYEEADQEEQENNLKEIEDLTRPEKYKKSEFPYDPKETAFWLEQASYFCGMAVPRMSSKKIPTQMLQVREAIFSSQIEGYQSTPQQVFESFIYPEKIECPSTKITRRCFNALRLIPEIRTQYGGGVVNKNVILDFHNELFRNDSNITGGRFRQIENHVGNYHPPKSYLVEDLILKLLEENRKQEFNIPNLILAGITHAQFENIHPFVDGNGRTGRMILSIMTGVNSMNNRICYGQLWSSYNMYEKRSDYYTALRSTLEDPKNPDFTTFVNYYLYCVVKGIAMTLNRLEEADRRFKKDQQKLKTKLPSKILTYLAKNPVTTEATYCKENYLFGREIKEARLAFNVLLDKNILKKSKDFPDIYVYKKYLKIFEYII